MVLFNKRIKILKKNMSFDPFFYLKKTKKLTRSIQDKSFSNRKVLLNSSNKIPPFNAIKFFFIAKSDSYLKNVKHSIFNEVLNKQQTNYFFLTKLVGNTNKNFCYLFQHKSHLISLIFEKKDKTYLNHYKKKSYEPCNVDLKLVYESYVLGIPKNIQLHIFAYLWMLILNRQKKFYMKQSLSRKIIIYDKNCMVQLLQQKKFYKKSFVTSFSKNIYNLSEDRNLKEKVKKPFFLVFERLFYIDQNLTLKNRQNSIKTQNIFHLKNPKFFIKVFLNKILVLLFENQFILDQLSFLRQKTFLLFFEKFTLQIWTLKVLFFIKSLIQKSLCLPDPLLFKLKQENKKQIFDKKNQKINKQNPTFIIKKKERIKKHSSISFPRVVKFFHNYNNNQKNLNLVHLSGFFQNKQLQSDDLLYRLFLKRVWLHTKLSENIFQFQKPKFLKQTKSIFDLATKNELFSMISQISYTKRVPNEIIYFKFAFLKFLLLFKTLNKVLFKTNNLNLFQIPLYFNIYFSYKKRLGINNFCFYFKIWLFMLKYLQFHSSLIAVLQKQKNSKFQKQVNHYYQLKTFKNETSENLSKKGRVNQKMFLQPICSLNKKQFLKMFLYNGVFNLSFYQNLVEKIGFQILKSSKQNLKPKINKHNITISNFSIVIQSETRQKPKKKRKKVHSQVSLLKLFFNIKPSDFFIKTYLKQLKNILKKYSSQSQNLIIKKLTPIILNNCITLRCISTKQPFYYIDSVLFLSLWKWACRRHPTKSKKWIKNKYFHKINGKNWIFSVKTQQGFLCLPLHRQVHLTAI